MADASAFVDDLYFPQQARRIKRPIYSNCAIRVAARRRIRQPRLAHTEIFSLADFSPSTLLALYRELFFAKPQSLTYPLTTSFSIQRI